jgi:2-polyprenyl-6-methoxyphenol hydroxylase-like FAD-dependent oxidoreductase
MAEINPMGIEETSIIIVGGGPTGALLSALLGQLEVPNVVLERGADITTDPRGIALDHDGLRLLQAIGMNERIFTRIGSCKCSPADI